MIQEIAYEENERVKKRIRLNTTPHNHASLPEIDGDDEDEDDDEKDKSKNNFWHAWKFILINAQNNSCLPSLRYQHKNIQLYFQY